MNRDIQEENVRHYSGTIIDPSLEDILDHIDNPHYAINMTIKRCRQLNLADESEKTGIYITTAKLITRVFQEMSDAKLGFEKVDASQKKLEMI